MRQLIMMLALGCNGDGDGQRNKPQQSMPTTTTCGSDVDTVGDGIDNNYDGVDGIDCDADGHASLGSGGDDCDDTNPAVHPGAEEVFYDGVDGDCDGGSDFDADGDGFDSDGFAGTDCDDTKAEVHPGAVELCDGADTDCDPATPEVATLTRTTGGVTAFATIQGAIDDVDDFDTVTICAGTHIGPWTIHGTSLTVQGMGADQTFLRGNGAEVLDIEGPIRPMDVAIRDIGFVEDGTTYSGYNDYFLYTLQGTVGGIRVVNANLEVERCSFEGLTGDAGGAIAIESDGVLTVTDTVFRNNAGGAGGGIYAAMSDVTLQRVQFIGNGGTALHLYETTAELTDVSFTDNTGLWAGAAMFIESEITGTNVTATGNRAWYCGGADIRNGTTVVATNWVFDGNSSTYDGGGLCMYRGAHLDATGGLALTNNSADNGGGLFFMGGGLLHGGPTEIVGSVDISSNQASYGGGIYFQQDGGDGVRIEAAIEDNSATARGGGIWVNSGQGFSLENSTLKRNSAGERGGGIYYHTDLQTRIDCVNVDFGGPADDNSPDDIDNETGWGASDRSGVYTGMCQ